MLKFRIKWQFWLRSKKKKKKNLEGFVWNIYLLFKYLAKLTRTTIGNGLFLVKIFYWSFIKDMGYFVMYFLLGEFGSLCPLKFVSILNYLVYQHEIIYNIVWLQISYLGALVVMWPLSFLLLGIFSFLISQPNLSAVLISTKVM